MKYVNKITILSFLFLLGISVLMVRCTSERQFRILSFFFDGVPDPSKAGIVTADSTNGTLAKNTALVHYIHPPFSEKKCKSCHQGGFSNALLIPMPDLCYTCHADFNTKYEALHGPVVSGNCTACHAAHESKIKKLLLREGQQLCLFCHESKDISRNKVHATIGTKNCTDCHDPHGGENRGILTQGICYNCHETFDAKYNFLHGPVVSVNCTGCHASHSSGAAKLILRKGQELCLFCHNEEQVYKNEAHKNDKKKNCTECHDPHGGADRFILTQAIRPFTVNPSVKKESKSGTDSVPLIMQEKPKVADTVTISPVQPVNSEPPGAIKEKEKADTVLQIIPEKTKAADSLIANPVQPVNSETPDPTKEKLKTDSVQQTLPEKTKVVDSSETKLLTPTNTKTPETLKEKESSDLTPVKQSADSIKTDSLLIIPPAPVNEKPSPEKTDTINVNWTAPKN